MNKPLLLRAADRERSKRRAQYRYKTTEHVQNRKHKRDMDGFFIPFAMFRPYNGSGLLCEVLGLTPARRMADLRVLQDYLMKEAYEHEIEMLMCQMRLHEFAFHRRFCTRRTEMGNPVEDYVDCYQNLANAIILLAVKDYKTILRRLMRNPYNQDAQREKKRLERFFFSQWFG